MQFEKILEKKPTDGTVSMQVFIPKEIHEFAAGYVAKQPQSETPLLTGDVYLNLLLRGIANVAKDANLFTAKRESKETFEHDKVYTVMYVPTNVNFRLEEIRKVHGGISKNGKSNSPKWTGVVPKRQIFSFLISLGFENIEKIPTL